MKKVVEKKVSEHGGAGVKLLLVLLVLFLIGNAGYQWIPIAYNGEAFKQDMQTAVIQGISTGGNNANPVEITKNKLMRSVTANSIPPNAFIDVKQKNNVLSARVAYTQQVPILPFGLYNYDYQFDHTATPSGFLTKD